MPAASTVPSLDTTTATYRGATTATLGATITSDGGAAITSRGTVWGTSANPTGNAQAEGGTAVATFTDARTGLTAGTLIYYRGYAVNSEGTGYSADGTFYTLSTEPTAQVTGFTAEDYLGTVETRLELSWTEVASADGYLILRDTSAPTGVPSDATAYTPGDLGGEVVALITSGSQVAWTNNSLTQDTHYYYKIFPFAYDGSHAETYNYKTDATVASDDTWTLADPPTGAAGTVAFSSVGYTDMTIGWAKGAGASDTLVIVSDASSSIGNPTNRRAYAVSTVYGGGDTTGTDDYCVYTSSGTEVTITGLTPGTTYYVEIFSYNGSAERAIQYYTTGPGTGSQATTARPTDAVWDGGGADNNTTTDANWDNDIYPAAGSTTVLRFSGSTRPTPANNYASGSDFGTIMFTNTTTSFTLSGNSVDIDDKIENYDASGHTISCDINNIGTDSLEINPVNGDLTLSGTIVNDSQDINVYGDNNHTLTLSGNLTGTGKLIVKQYSKAVIAASLGFSGNIEIDEGEVWLAEGGALGGNNIYIGNAGMATDTAKLWLSDSDGGTTFNEPIQVNWADVGYRYLGSLNGTGENEFSGTIQLNAQTYFEANQAGGTLKVSGVISGASTNHILVNGPGKVILSGANDLGGNAYVLKGTLELGNADPFDNGGVYIGETSGSDDATLTLGTGSGLDIPVIVRDGGTGTRSLVAGNGSGTVTISGGYINLNTNLSVVVNSGGDFTIGINVNMSADSVSHDMTITGANDMTISGAILAQDGGCEVNYNGSGTLTLSGDNATTVDNQMMLNIGGGGTLSVSAKNNFGDDPSAAYNDKINFSASGGTLLATETFSMDSGANDWGMTVANTVTAVLSVDNTKTLTFPGVISGAGGIVQKAGTGTLILSGTSTYTGASTLSAGTLVVNGDIDTSASLAVAASSTLAGDGSVPVITVNGEVDPGDGSASTDIATLTAEGVNIEASGSYRIDFGDINGSAGTDWDLIDASSGTIDNNVGVGTDFTLELHDDNISGWDQTSNFTWVVISGSTFTDFDGNDFTIDTTDWPAASGTFSTTNTGNDLVLVYRPADTVPVLSSPTATAITPTTAILGATITDDGGQAITSRGTVWGTSANPTGNSQAEGGTAVGTFTDARTGFSAGTLYYYRGYAVNSEGTGYSADGTFYTLSSEPSTDVSGFSSDGYSGTSTQRLDLSWTAPGGGEDGYIILRSTAGTPDGTPVDATGYSVGNSLGNGVVAAVIDSGTQVAWTNLGLLADTRYYYKIFPFGYNGSNSETYNYKTSGTPGTDDCYTLAVPPSGSPSGVGGSQTYNTATITWTKGAASSETLIIMSDGVIGTDPSDRNSYAASTNYGSGFEIGTDEFVVYAGSATEITVAGLTPNTHYYIELFAYNGSVSTSMNYNTTETAVEIDTSDRPTSAVWDGGGADNNMKTDLNWDVDVYPNTGTVSTLNFAGSTRTTPNNDYAANSDFGTIDFNSGASSFTLAGNVMDLATEIINNSGNEQTISLNIVNIGASILELNAESGDLSISGDIDNGGQNIEAAADTGNDVNLSGNVSGAGKLIVQSNTLVKITGASTYTGNTEIDEGEFWIGAGGTVGGGMVYVGNGGQQDDTAKLWISDMDGGTTVNEPITINAANSSAYRVVGGIHTSGTNIFSGTLTLNGDVTLAQTVAAGLVEFSGIISGNNKVIVQGPGTIIMSAANTFTNNLYIVSGGLTLRHADPFDMTAGSKVNIGETSGTDAAILTLDLAGMTLDSDVDIRDGSSGIKTIKASENATISGGIAVTETTDALVDFDVETGKTLTMSGIISGDAGGGEITKKGTGTLVLSGVNTFDKKVDIQAGTVSISASRNLGADPGGAYANKITLNGGTLEATATFELHQNNSITLGASDGTIDVESGVTLTYSGDISDANDLTKTDTGTLLLDGTSSFTGSTTINNGYLAVTGDIDTSSGITIAASGTLQGNGSVPVITVTGEVDPNDGSSATAIATLTVEGVNIEAGGTYRIDFGDVDGSEGTDWDLIDSDPGTIANNVGGGADFTIELHDDAIASWDKDTDYTWIIMYGASFTGFDANDFTVDSGSTDVGVADSHEHYGHNSHAWCHHH